MKQKIKKVLFNGSMIDNNPTGVGIVSTKIIQCFPKKINFNVTIFTPATINTQFKIVPLCSFLRADKYHKLASIVRFLWNQINLTYYGWQYDICYSPTTHGSIFLNNQIITIHDVICLNYPNNHKIQYYYFKYIIPIYIRKAKKIITISEFVKQDIIKFYKCDPNKIVVIYNGVDMNDRDKLINNSKFFLREKLNQIKKKSFILTVGATYKHKNIESIIRGFSVSNAKNDNALVIVGRASPYLSSLKELVRHLDMNKDVVFLGYITRDELLQLYANTKLLVYLSLYEGFGLPILEALSQSCPVLASDIDVFHEISGDNCTYVNPLDIITISNNIDEIVFNKSSKSPINNSFLEQYNWNKTSEKVFNLIKLGLYGEE